MDQFQYADIIILALIAGLVLLRLRSTLGKDIGHKPDLTLPRAKPAIEEGERVIHLHDTPTPAPDREEKDALAMAEIANPEVSQKLVAMREADPAFSVKEFVDGAKSAFEWVLTAFNRGDKPTLKQLMSADVYQEFVTALDSRKEDDKPETTLVSIVSADLVDAMLDSSKAQITVRFVTEQIQVARGADGKVISGDPSRIHTIRDEWVFERALKSRNPNWTIIDT